MPTPTLIKTPETASSVSQVTDAELARYAELIYQRTGIRVSERKKTLLSNRLRRRLRETGMKDFGAYLKHLEQLRPSHAEWDAFFQEITTHETYLFRDEVQWDWFRSFIKQRWEESQSNKELRKLRIWSAACSTGDEACTAACCIASGLPCHGQWNVRILGTDIGIGAVEQASQFTYGRRAMQKVPPADLRFFQEDKEESQWRARPILTQMMSFRQHNLMGRLVEPPFDVVFLKNVLIYFDAASKKTVVGNVRAAVAPGGMLVAGAAEGVGDLLNGFKRLRPWLFQRPLE